MHLVPRKKEWEEISNDDANRRHMHQTLTGDSGDCYPGCPGIGDVKASSILDWSDSAKDRWEIVVVAFEAKGRY